MSKKAKVKKLANTQNDATAELPELPPPFFPFARYTSIVGVHTTLLAFIALFLPQSTLLLTKSFQDTSVSPLTRVSQHEILEVFSKDPLSTLAYLCGGTMFVQGWWGGWVRQWWVEYTLQTSGSAEENYLAKKYQDARKWHMLKRAWLTTFLATIPVHAILVLFGAPIATYVLHTYLLSCLLCLLVIFTPAYTLGSPSLSPGTESLVTRLTWIRLFAELSTRNAVERAMVYPAIGAVLGCWCGVFPLALDWDRPWQAWPLAPSFGAFIGYILASIWALSVSATTFIVEEHIRSKVLKTKKD